ncbi:MFS transporter [Endozoicomonas acroporae]|uniref:MFS transporter n=1 Tax=Endozoicomonas acroporae TaxID=1701104 RepID=UPI0013D45A77|nr:MFS transporter [Endozoicomonas acroporae]
MESNSLSKWKIFFFSFGNFGWCLATFSYSILITYFYYPPATESASQIPEFISRAPVLFGITTVGLIYALNRALDAITDPIIANLSDRSTSRFGRRRLFMMLSFLPTGLMSAAIFFPPVDTVSSLNIVWLVMCCVIVTVSVTMYVVPYMSLIPELGKTDHDRIMISTFCSVSWALAFAFGQLIWVIKDYIQSLGYTPVEAIQVAVSLFSVLGMLAMVVPVLAINEQRDCRGSSTNEDMLTSLKTAMANKNFSRFTACNGLAFMTRFFLEVGAIYYVTMLMGLEESTASIIMLLLFLASFALYPAVVALSKRYSKKSLFRTALFVQGLLLSCFSLCTLVGRPDILGWALLAFMPFPLAIMGIIPNVIVADLALSDAAKTGNHKEAMFFGANMFAYKAATSLTALLFPSIIIIGSIAEAADLSPEPTTLGVTLSALLAGCLAFLGTYLMGKYDEKQVMAQIEPEPAENTFATA